jgi:hypothetical protein
MGDKWGGEVGAFALERKRETGSLFTNGVPVAVGQGYIAAGSSRSICVSRLARAMGVREMVARPDRVDIAILETPRGNGKSSGGGALAVWALFDDDETGSPQVPIVATTIGQAIRSCYGVAVSMIKAEPELLRRSLIYTGIATPRVTVPFNEGELFPISNDPDGLLGLDPSLALVDEIGFQPLASLESLRLAGGKRDRSLVVGVGTPGLDRDNALYHVRSLVRDPRQLPLGKSWPRPFFFSAPLALRASNLRFFAGGSPRHWHEMVLLLTPAHRTEARGCARAGQSQPAIDPRSDASLGSIPLP